MPNWEQAFKGGAGGALGGAGLGGPVGAAIGGGVGFLGGLLSGGENENDAARRKMLMDYFAQAGGMQAPQVGQAAQGAYSGFRQNQSSLITRLEALASGQGPSLASQQFKEATDRNQASQAGMANSGRGGPMAAINAQNNMGLLGAQAAQGAASSRIQEQQMALQMLGGNIQAGRGADEGMNQFNAGQQNQNSLANLDARLKTMGLQDNVRLQILQQLGGQNAQAQGQVGLGDQILAGGAGLYSMGAAQSAQNKMPGGFGGMAGAGVPKPTVQPGPAGGWSGQSQQQGYQQGYLPPIPGRY